MILNSNNSDKNQSVIITGTSGLLGKNLHEKISKKINVIKLSRKNYDYYYEMSSQIDEAIPKGLVIKTFIHVAYEHSSKKIGGENINIFALNSIKKFCISNNIQLIYISSMAALSAISEYGRCKRECELIVESIPNSKILRLGMLYGEDIGLIYRIRRLISKLPFIPIPGDGKFCVYLADIKKVVEYISNQKFTNQQYYYLVDRKENFISLINQKNKLQIFIPISLIKLMLFIPTLLRINLKSISYDGFIGLINPPILPNDVKTYEEN